MRALFGCSGPWAGLHMTAVSAAALPLGVFLVLWEAEVLPGPLKYIFSRQRADGLVHIHPLGPAPRCPWGS